MAGLHRGEHDELFLPDGRLVFQNFIGAAVGTSVLLALIRGIVRKEGRGIGNFWADMIRGTLFVFLPLSFVFAIALHVAGGDSKLSSLSDRHHPRGSKADVPQGPVASQAAIKLLGGNGGGFFNANTQHPFENPTALSGFFQAFAMLLIPSALVYLLGLKTSLRHGWSVWWAMCLLFLGGVFLCAHYEHQGNPAFTQHGCASSLNMEGKETRFGIFHTALIATTNTDSGAGSMNTLDSFTPMGGLIPLLNLLVGEVIFGGVGSGLYGMLMFVLLTVFIAGLMVGRTPEYMGKKIGGREMKFVMLTVDRLGILRARFFGLGCAELYRARSLGNAGPHGFTELFYAYASSTMGNGSCHGRALREQSFFKSDSGDCHVPGAIYRHRADPRARRIACGKESPSRDEGTFPTQGPLFVSLLSR